MPNLAREFSGKTRDHDPGHSSGSRASRATRVGPPLARIRPKRLTIAPVPGGQPIHVEASETNFAQGRQGGAFHDEEFWIPNARFFFNSWRTFFYLFIFFGWEFCRLLLYFRMETSNFYNKECFVEVAQWLKFYVEWICDRRNYNFFI